MKTFPELVAEEIKRARKSYSGKQASLHEGYAVLLEEVEEFWEEVKLKRSKRNYGNMIKELVQVAAMAQRTAEEVVMAHNHR